MFSVSCARGSKGPIEPAEGDVRSISTGCHDVRALHSNDPVGTRESTRPTSNDVNFGYREDNIPGYRRCDECRIDAVSIRRDPMTRPRARGKSSYIGQ